MLLYKSKLTEILAELQTLEKHISNTSFTYKAFAKETERQILSLVNKLDGINASIKLYEDGKTLQQTTEKALADIRVVARRFVTNHKTKKKQPKTKGE